MIIDDLSIALSVLVGIRIAGVLVFIISFYQSRNLINLIYMIGWFVYLAGPISVLATYSGADAQFPTVFPYTAAAGIMILMYGNALHILKKVNRKSIIMLLVLIVIFTALFFTFSKYQKITAPAFQGGAVIFLFIFAIYQRHFFIKNRTKLSFFWLLVTLAMAIYHAAGFNHFNLNAKLSVRFVVTAMLNLSVLLYLIYLDWEQTKIEIESSIHEKEILLQEVHHRVKNNLMIISSMLRLQESNIEDGDKLEIIRSIENRINSMAIVHEQLYKSQNFKRIKLSEYIKDLTDMIKVSFNSEDKPVDIRINVEPVYFDINNLIPLGMLVNEIITNSFKHAFKDTAEPQINISLSSTDDKKCIIMISDNGSGFSVEDTAEKNESTGFIIIDALVTQLKAELSIKNDGGTEYLLVMKMDPNRNPKKIRK